MLMWVRQLNLSMRGASIVAMMQSLFVIIVKLCLLMINYSAINSTLSSHDFWGQSVDHLNPMSKDILPNLLYF